jgi:hypothetical protein
VIALNLRLLISAGAGANNSLSTAFVVLVNKMQALCASQTEANPNEFVKGTRHANIIFD